jgi:hypothetical protein
MTWLLTHMPHKEQLAAAEATSAEEGIDANAMKVAADDDMAPTKKPRKLVRTNIERSEE